MQQILSMFKSKKFVTWFVALLIPILNKQFGWGLGVEEVLAILASTGAFAIGQGIADAGSKGATSGTTSVIAEK